MTILTRYLFRQTAASLLLVLASLTGVTWIAVALRQLELMTSQGQSAFAFLKITVLAIPSLMAFIAPMAFLIAVLHVLNKLNSDSELIVMTAGGASVWRLMKPVLALGIGISLTVGFINNAITPWANKAFRDSIRDSRTDLIAQVLQPGRFIQPEPGLTVHIRDRGRDGQLLGLAIHDARNPQDVTTFLAERGLIVRQEDKAYLLMQNGHILRTPQDVTFTDIIAFERHVISLDGFEQRVGAAAPPRASEMSWRELVAALENPVRGVAPGRVASEVHDRIAPALLPTAFAFLAMAFAGQAQTTRTNRVNLLIAAFALGVGARLASVAAANATVTRPGLWPLNYAVPLGLMIGASILIFLNTYPRPPSRLSQHVSRQFSSLKLRISALFNRKVWSSVGSGGASR